MARTIGGRVILEGGLVFDEPLHIGGMSEEAGLDALHVRDGLDRHVLPGSSILGVLRSWLVDVSTMHLPDVSMGHLFGGVDDSSSGASRIRVRDVVLDGLYSEVVDNVGIDRFSGSAATGVKFDRVVLRQKSGTVARFVLECDFGGPISREDAVSVATAVAAAMNSGILRLGAGTTRGLGGFRLVGVNGDGVPRMGVETLDRQGVLDRISGKRRLDPVRDLPDVSGSGLTVSATFSSRTPTFVKSSLDGKLLDTLPRVVARGGHAFLVIPGSSIKGVMRSELERHVRSVLASDVDVDAPHHEQVRAPFVDELFGYANSAESADVSSGLKATVRVGDLMGRLVTSTGTPLAWEQWESVRDSVMSNKTDPDADRKRVVDALRAAGLANWQPTDHVAIDRWTSGVTDSKLFSVLEPHGVEWEALKVQIDGPRLERLGRDPRSAVAAVIFLLRQLHSGAIGLGWGTHRGHGSVSVIALSVTGLEGGARLDLASIDPTVDLMSQIESVDSSTMSQLRKAWTQELPS
ncbi:MAG: hypothetical protein RLZ37_373 [Actinomycetota bacterium]|jgi:CRISPR/Cas system CSM-associated protein Csm3 (group 7 of RAMP superfamily)